MKKRGMGCATKGGGCCMGGAKEMKSGGYVKKMKCGGMAHSRKKP